jgi:hypothetical protein
MHLLKHPRNAIFVGLLFVAISFVYWAVPYALGQPVDYAGVTMLAILGIAMSLMAYVLIAGSTND